MPPLETRTDSPGETPEVPQDPSQHWTGILTFPHLHPNPISHCLSLLVVPCAQSLSRVQLFVTLWTVACQAPLSLGFSRQEYWSGLPFSPPGDLPNPGMEPERFASPALQTDSLPLSHRGSPSSTYPISSYLCYF